MATNDDNPAVVPVFKECARCGYSLQGLPASHACPECGLRFDRRCALYRVTNPKPLFAFSLAAFGGGWLSLRHLPDFANLSNASAGEITMVVVAALWIVCVVVGFWAIVSGYRCGFEVAITSDGLIVRLLDFNEDLIPWSDISGASIKDCPVKSLRLQPFS